jgi:hypothetical protein
MSAIVTLVEEGNKKRMIVNNIKKHHICVGTNKMHWKLFNNMGWGKGRVIEGVRQIKVQCIH